MYKLLRLHLGDMLYDHHPFVVGIFMYWINNANLEGCLELSTALPEVQKLMIEFRNDGCFDSAVITKDEKAEIMDKLQELGSSIIEHLASQGSSTEQLIGCELNDLLRAVVLFAKDVQGSVFTKHELVGCCQKHSMGVLLRGYVAPVKQ